MRLAEISKLQNVFDRRYKSLVEHSKNYRKRPPNKDRLWAEVLKCFEEGDKCCYCGTQMVISENPPIKSFSTDHYIPLSSGGNSRIENLVICCYRCNLAKGTLDGKEFKELLDIMDPDRRERFLNKSYRGKLADKIHRDKEEKGEPD